MSMSRMRFLNRSMQSSRSRPSQAAHNTYKVDPTKSHLANALHILRELTVASGGSTDEAWRLSLLSALVKLLVAAQSPDAEQPQPAQQQQQHIAGILPARDYLYCLSASLVQPVTQIRAATLRALRHSLGSERDVVAFNDLQLPHLLGKSLDVLLDNEEERVQAMKLIRKILSVAPRAISPVVVRSLVALGDSVSDEGDRMLRACLAILCEIGVLNPRVLIMCGGVSAITRNVLECHSPRIAESLVGVLLHMLEQPHTRRMAGVRLDCLAAPYCDFTYRLGIMDKNKDARDLRFTSSRLALLTVLRSWAGTIEFCNPNRASGLKAIVDVLYLNQLEVRKAILDLLYELLWLPQPVWTDEYSVALSVIDPADYQDSWRLAEGFVAAEGRAVLPTLAARVPNICEMHTALLLYCFLETGLLNALVEVVVSGDTFISVRATVLIGKLLQLMHHHLPADILNSVSALPSLVAHATRGNPQARGAIAALQSLHQMMRNRPAACSLFLEAIIQSGGVVNSRAFRRDIDASGCVATAAAAAASGELSATDAGPHTPDQRTATLLASHSMDGSTIKRRTRLDSVGSSLSNSGEEHHHRGAVHSMTNTLRRVGTKRMRALFAHGKQNDRWLRESNVMLSDDEKQWDWDIILTFLKTEAVNKMDDTHCRFIRRLVNFFKPSSNRFSHQDLGHGRYTPTFVTAGLELIDWLLQSQALECIRLLTDLCTDISTHLMAISTARSAHDCLFSPQHMGSTMCQQYFLFIGRMCRTQKGVSILNNTDIFERLSGIVQSTIHVCYIKLIVSGLDYTFAERPREILQQALHGADRRAGQLYATQFMMVLLRARLPGFEVWGLPMLVRQMCDAQRVVAMAAHEVLDEATHCRVYLEALVEMWPQWERVGDAGVLTRTRFYSLARGLNHAAANVRAEIGRWVQGYNKSYVLLCEADTHSVLTLHTKNEEGAYSRRSCSSRPTFVAPHLLPHLYGQLVQTTQGMENLLRFGDLPQLCATLQRLAAAVARPPPASNRGGGGDNDATEDDTVDPDQRSLDLKAAIWALCHASTSRIGLQHMRTLDGQFVERIVELAKHSGVYSVRATAFHALGLVGSTKAGADYLFALDWVCVRHDRDTQWPISEPEDWLSKHLHAMRHALDSVPPYNYAGIDDQMSVSRYSGGSVPEKAHQVLQQQLQQQQTQAQTSLVDAATVATIPSVAAVPNRSKTLPDGCAVRAATSAASYYKHTRSLSESKTSEILTLNAATAAAAGLQRTRFNSGTDSNTSGVSSCESVYGIGRYPLLNDHHPHTNTLSPIPSSSNLLDVAQLSASAVAASAVTAPSSEGAGRIRRISLTGASFRENTLSVQDAQGYAALRRLRSSQRPVFAEGAMTTGGADDDVVDCGAVERREKSTAELLRLSTLAATRGLKVRSLDRQSAFVMGIDHIRKRTQSCDSTITELNILFANEPSGPCYTGICLPKNILDLFHTGEPPASAGHSYITQISFQDDDSGHEFKPIVLQSRSLLVGAVPPQQQQQQHHISQRPGGVGHHVQLSRSFSVIDAFGEYDPVGGGATTNDTSSMSSLSDISSATSSTSRRSRWMSKHNRQQCFHCCRLTGAGRGRDDGFGGATTSAVAVPRRRFSAPLSPPTPLQLSASEAATNTTNSCSDFSDAADRISETILRHVQRMANPVWSKQSKMALLELKQKHGTAYQDVCLYAEVCRALSTNTYRLPARRFLQELFLDLQFEGFARTAAEAFARCEPDVLRRVALEEERRVAVAAAAVQSQRRTGEEATADAVDAGAELRQVQGHTQQHGEHVYATVKTLRHTLLPSVTEASVENLCESLGNKSRHLAVGHKTTNDIRRNSPHQRHSNPNPALSKPPEPSAASSTASSPPLDQRALPAMRPRFNTLELDLTCTRNKFPITDRRKQIQQQLQQTSAPATPSEWSFQHSRTSIAAGSAAITATSGANNGGIPSVVAATATAVASGSESSSSTASNGSVLIAAMQTTTTTTTKAELKPTTTAGATKPLVT